MRFSVGQAILVLRHLCVNLSEVIDLDSSRTKRVKNSVGRALFVAVSVLLQAVWIVGLGLLLNDYYYVVSLVTSLLAFLVVLNLYGQQMTGPLCPGHGRVHLFDVWPFQLCPRYAQAV